MSAIRSFWNAPDPIFAPQGLYLGSRDEAMDRLYAARSAVGVILLLLVSPLAHSKDESKSIVLDIYRGMLFTFVYTVVAAFCVSILLVLTAKRGSRLEILWQLRWPFLTNLATLAFGMIFSVVISLAMISPEGRNSKFFGSPVPMGVILSGIPQWLLVALKLFGGFWSLLLVVWSFKISWLVVSGVLRASDGHPLLAPIAITVGAWSFLLINYRDVSSDAIGLTQAVAAPIGVTILASYEVARLWRRYPQDFPFRNGPLI